MKRLLIVGAGATIEECIRSGKDKENNFPTIRNFANRLFQESYSLQIAIANYLKVHGINFNSKILESYKNPSNETIEQEAFQNSPLEIFKRLEKEDFEHHNVENFFEYTWNTMGTKNPGFWHSVVHDGIYWGLSLLFIDQFGVNGPAGPFKTMTAGLIICDCLYLGDRVINLNYDIAFDIAIRQSGKRYCYSPNFDNQNIIIYKPHGSLNLYQNRQKQKFILIDPYEYGGSLTYPDDEGGKWEAYSPIIPPRLNKQYEQHPIARKILESILESQPKIVTFWGVGLTNSDVDLMSIYINACDSAHTVEFINPLEEAHKKACKLLRRDIQFYETLDEWEALKLR